MVIKALAIPGGGPTGFISYGAIKESALAGLWKIEDLENIYGTSIGGLVGLMLSLNYDWETLDEYLVNRPWEDCFPEPDYYEIYANKGYELLEFVKNMVNPLLNGKDLSENITLLELYNYNNIGLNFICGEINTSIEITTEVINYINYPNMPLHIAITASMGIPMLFAPVSYDNKIFIDGGVIYNCPLPLILEKNNLNEKEILTFQNSWNRVINIDLPNINLFQYLGILVAKTHATLQNLSSFPKYTNLINCEIDENIDWINIIYNKEERSRLIEIGKQNFLKSEIDLKID